MTLLALATAWLAGVYLGVRLDTPAPALGLFAVAFGLLAALLATVRLSSLPVLVLAALALGALRVALLTGDPGADLNRFYGVGRVLVEGVVVADPEAAGSVIRLRLAVDRIQDEGEWVDTSGDVLATLRQSDELAGQRERPYFRYGDRLALEGVVDAPPALEGFDYAAYLARQGIGSVMSFPNVTLVGEGEGVFVYRWLYGVRRSMADSLAQVVPEPQASLGQALLLGMRENLPTDLVEKFRVTGTSHLLAISGLHVGILLGLSLAASRWALGRRRQLYLIAPFILIWLYALIAGMSPSVVRAAIMGSVYLAALALGRPRSVLPALGLAAAVMVGHNPNVLWSVSFQLSFAAMAGIAVLAEPIDGWLRTRLRGQAEYGSTDAPALATVSVTAAMTVAATVATLPLVAFYFQRVSLVGLPATILALPALPPVLVTQALAGVVGLVATPPALPLGWLAWVATGYMTGVVGLFAALPSASLETGRIAPLLVWAYYGVFAMWPARRRLHGAANWGLPRLRATSLRPRIAGRGVPWWALVTVVSVAVLVWAAALSLPDGRLHVTFADVGQGDAILITTPGGQRVLIDGGPDPVEAARLLGASLPFWDRSIELVVLTHPHSDHVTGLTEALRRYQVHSILEREVQPDSLAYREWRQAVEDEGAVVTQARAGQVIAVDDGVYFQVLGPPETLIEGTASDVNNASVVLRLVYGNVSFLLTGDVFSEAEADLVEHGAPVDSDVLKVAHHGSRSSSSEAFLGSVTPVVAIISAGEGNRFGHPHPETEEALLRHVAKDRLFVTKDRGTIEVVTDGKRLEVKTER